MMPKPISADKREKIRKAVGRPRMATETIESIKAMLLARIPVNEIAAKKRITPRTVYRIKESMPSMLPEDSVRFFGPVQPSAIVVQATIYARTERGRREKARDAGVSEADLALSPEIAPIAAVEHIQSLQETLDNFVTKSP